MLPGLLRYFVNPIANYYTYTAGIGMMVVPNYGPSAIGGPNA